MKIIGEYALREIAGEYILVPIGSTALEMNGIITMNELGIFIWERLQQECSYDKLLEDVLESFEVERARAKTDLDDFLSKMRSANLIDD